MNYELIYNKNSEFLLIECIDSRDSESVKSQYAFISENTDKALSFLTVSVDDWNSELSPWEAKAVFGKDDFGGKAGETLENIDKLINTITKEYRFSKDIKLVIGGYSLAALFALWCGYVSDSFCGVAAASPSVWFDGWREFAAENKFKAKTAYLSLGNTEEKTKNQRMSTVRRNIEIQHEMLTKSGIDCVFELNEGNHFKDADCRTAKAFLSIINR